MSYQSKYLNLLGLLGAVGLGFILASCGQNSPDTPPNSNPTAVSSKTTAPVASTSPTSSLTTATTSAVTTVANGGVASAAKPGDSEHSLTVGGRDRTYLLHLPPAISAQKPLPLLFILHGGGGQGRAMEGLTGFNKVADREGFIAVYPDGLDRNWNDGREAPALAAQRENVDDVGFVSALIDELNRTLKLDQKRVYVTGMSNGGIFSQRLGCELGAKIAAIAPVAGTLPEKLGPTCTPVAPLSVLMIHGTADSLVPYNGGDVTGQPRRGSVLSVDATIKHWVTQNKCAASPTVTQEPDRNPQDGTTVRRETYSQCKAGSEVTLYRIENGGHTWPGGLQYLPESTIGKTSRDINASDLIWQFFAAHPK